MSGHMLSDLRPGQKAVILSVGGERRFRLRLAELGLIPGTQVQLRRRAPLGDPIEIRLRGYALSIRLKEARKIEVQGGERIGKGAPVR
jgi:Fe2+ transport system protein FeoA